MESILKKIDQKKFKVRIIDLGYVGLPLMWTFNQIRQIIYLKLKK